MTNRSHNRLRDALTYLAAGIYLAAGVVLAIGLLIIILSLCAEGYFVMKFW